jgi:hypothetical protein
LTQKYCFLAVAAILFFGASGLADNSYSVSFVYTNNINGNGALGGALIYPYALGFGNYDSNTGLFDGPGPSGQSANPWAVCDAFNNPVTGGESWTASLYTIQQIVTDPSVLALTMFGAGTTAGAEGTYSYNTSSAAVVQGYEAIAELTTEMTQCSPVGNCAADYNYAIWEIFDGPSAGSCATPSSVTGGAFANISGTDLSTAQTEYCQALGESYTSNEFPNLEVLVPVPGSEGSTYSSNGTP